MKVLKILLLFAIIIANSNFTYCQSETYFNRFYEKDSTVDIARCLIHQTDSTYTYLYSSWVVYHTPYFKYRFFVKTFDKKGNIIKSVKYDKSDTLNDIFYEGVFAYKYSKNRYIIPITIGNLYSSELDVYLLKSNNDSIFDFIRYSDTTFATTKSLAISKDSMHFVIPYEKTTKLYYVPFDANLMKIDTSGNVIWKKNIGYNGYSHSIWKIILLDDGGFLMTGSILNWSTSQTNMFLARTDSMGNVMWRKIIGGSNRLEMGADLIQSKEGGYMLCGVREKVSGDGLGWIYKFKEDSNNNYVFEWDKTYEVVHPQVNFDDGFWKIIQLEDSSYVLLGVTENANLDGYVGDDDAWLMKVDYMGNEIWSRFYSNSSASTPSARQDYLYTINRTPDNGFILSGSCYNQTQDGWLLKLDSCGCDSIRCYYDSTQNCGVPLYVQEVKIYDSNLIIYPNPIESTFYVEFAEGVVQQQPNTTVKMYNILGKEVFSKEFPSSKNKLKINIPDLSSGVYILEVLGVGKDKIMKK